MIGEWISVKDKMPKMTGKVYQGSLEDSEEVLIYGKDPYGHGGYGIGVYVVDHNEGCGDWTGSINGYDTDYTNVSHWAKLPAPPEVKS